MEEGDLDGNGGLAALTQWFWSRPLNQHKEEEELDEQVETLEEAMWLPEQEAQVTNSFSQKTVSKATPPGVSSSGRIYQTVQRSQMDYSRPTMNIRSIRSFWSSSQKPLQPPPVQSLMNWTHTASSSHSPARLTNSASRRLDAGLLPRKQSTASSGTLPRTISSTSSTREMAVETPQAPSASRFG